MEDQIKRQARPETGAMEFPDDWPGVFIRGDNCFGYKIALDAFIREEEKKIEPGKIGYDVMGLMMLRSLSNLLGGSDTRTNPVTQKAQLRLDP